MIRIEIETTEIINQTKKKLIDNENQCPTTDKFDSALSTSTNVSVTIYPTATFKEYMCRLHLLKTYFLKTA